MVRFLLATLAGLLLLGPGPSAAQSYPDKPIKIVVGFTAGGIADHEDEGADDRSGDPPDAEAEQRRDR